MMQSFRDVLTRVRTTSGLELPAKSLRSQLAHAIANTFFASDIPEKETSTSLQHALLWPEARIEFVQGDRTLPIELSMAFGLMETFDAAMSSRNLSAFDIALYRFERATLLRKGDER